MSEKLVKIFNNLNLNNKIGHAYLIANTNLESVCEELKEVLYKFIFKYLIMCAKMIKQKEKK